MHDFDRFVRASTPNGLAPARLTTVAVGLGLAFVLMSCATLEPPTYQVASGAEGQRQRCSKAESAVYRYGPVLLVVTVSNREPDMIVAIRYSAAKGGAHVEPFGEVGTSIDGGITVARPASLGGTRYEGSHLKQNLAPGSGLPATVPTTLGVSVAVTWPISGAKAAEPPKEIEITPPGFRINGEAHQPPKVIFRLSDGHAIVPLCLAEASGRTKT